MALSLVTEAKDSNALTKTDSGMVSALTRIIIAPIKAISPSKEYVSTQEQGFTALAWGAAGVAGMFFFQKYQKDKARQRALVASTGKW